MAVAVNAFTLSNKDSRGTAGAAAVEDVALIGAAVAAAVAVEDVAASFRGTFAGAGSFFGAFCAGVLV